MRANDRRKSPEHIQLLESKVRKLSFLEETCRLLTATLDLDRLLHSVTAQVRDYFRAEAASVAVLDEDSEQRTFRVVPPG